ncbi:MAG: tetratricopeptide repeat protein [bacterium]|nr:tetratricopeptide repeat protein [bacterium]
MLRLAGFFFVVFLALQVLRTVLGPVPLIGAVFRMPLIGFWVTAILVSVAASKLAADALDRRKRATLIRELGAVDTPHNKGKLGSLFVSQGRARKALPYLETAVGGEPEIAEWHYRLGQARLATGDRDGARESLESALAIDEEHAYGSALMRYVEALAGEGEKQLEQLDRFERNHGENPESAYRRGAVLKSLGRGAEARAAFARVPEIAANMAKYQKKSSAGWVLKANLARFGG